MLRTRYCAKTHPLLVTVRSPDVPSKGYGAHMQVPDRHHLITFSYQHCEAGVTIFISKKKNDGTDKGRLSF